MEQNGVSYAEYDTQREDNVRVGVIIIDAGKKKKTSVSGQYIVSRDAGIRRNLPTRFWASKTK